MEFVRSSISIVSGLPCDKARSAPAITFSRPAQRSLTLWPARSPSRLATLYTEGSDSFVASAAASIATGWSEPVPGRELHPLKSSAFSRRTLSPATVEMDRAFRIAWGLATPRNLPRRMEQALENQHSPVRLPLGNRGEYRRRVSTLPMALALSILVIHQSERQSHEDESRHNRFLDILHPNRVLPCGRCRRCN